MRTRRTRPARRLGSGRPSTGVCRSGLLASLGAVVALVGGLGAVLVAAGPAGAVTPPAQGWTTQEAPLPADAGSGSTDPHVYTSSSSCPSATTCTTVGWYDDTTGRPWGLIEMENGGTWGVTEAPQPSDAGSGSGQGLWLGSPTCGIANPCHAVSCPNATFCIAVGEYLDASGGSDPVVETYDGTGWTAMQAPQPSDAAASSAALLTSVTCTSTTTCFAVGQYTNSSGARLAMIDTLLGSTWSSQAPPEPPNLTTSSPYAYLGNVACGLRTTCVASGFYNLSGGGEGGLIAMLSGGTWTMEEAPVPADAFTGSSPYSQLFDVACPSPDFCVSVGEYRDSLGYAALVDTSSGSTWTASQAPEPSDAGTGSSQNALLYGVSCPSTTACDAIGDYRDGSDRPWGLIDTYAAGTWTATQAPQPADAAPESGQDAGLESVSCPTPSFSATVGFYENTANQATGYVVSLSGGSWHAMVAPLPADATSTASDVSFARTVACSSPVACTVGGWYPDPAGHTQGFLDLFTGVQGYWLAATDGGVFTYGNAQFQGSTGSLHLNAPVVGLAPTADGQGYWLVASDGGIFDYGDAGFFGSRGGQPLNRPIVGMAATPDGKGYWLVASDGGIFGYGDAGFFGSRGGQPLNRPIVGMAATPDGKGYWLVASDGGIFGYGDAAFYGSTGGMVLNKPVVGMAATPTGLGYWLVASDGGIFNYGDAGFFGSTGSLRLNKPVVGMTGSPSGLGYWLVASDGGIFNYGDAPFYGSAGSLVLNKPVVGMAG